MDLSGTRVLVVEDTFLVSEMICDLLQAAGCIVVGPAAQLAQGTELAEHEPVDFAVLDVNLAGDESFPIASVLRRRGIPFAFLTGYGRDILPALFQGSPCLAKPFHADDLMDMVRDGGQGGSGTPGPVST